MSIILVGVSYYLVPDNQFTGIGETQSAGNGYTRCIVSGDGTCQAGSGYTALSRGSYIARYGDDNEHPYHKHHALHSLQKQFLDKMPSEVRVYVDEEIAKWQTPLVREWDEAHDLRIEQQKIPRYKYVGKDKQEQIWALRNVYDDMMDKAEAAKQQGNFSDFQPSFRNRIFFTKRV